MYFENENREFLEKYDSASKQIEYYTKQVKRIFLRSELIMILLRQE